MPGTSIAEILAADIKNRPEINFPWRPDIMAMQPAIEYAVDAAGAPLVTQSMLAAIIDRETGFRNIFQEGVPRGPGCGVGPCQITSGVDWTDLDHPTYNGTGLDLTVVRNNLLVCCRNFLVPVLREFGGSHQEAFDAYNLGGGNVENEIAQGKSPDTWTTGGNYGRSVMQNWITYAGMALNMTPDWSSWQPL
jgi:hypothetical protein